MTQRIWWCGQRQEGSTPDSWVHDCRGDVFRAQQINCLEHKERYGCGEFLLVPVGGLNLEAAADVFVAKAGKWEQQIEDFPSGGGHEPASEMARAVVFAYLGEQGDDDD